MEQVTARSVVLNLYYLVGEYAGNGKWTKNFGEIFFEIGSNPFGVHNYLQVYPIMNITLARRQFQR